MMYIDEGWLSAAQRRYSPNFGARPNPPSIDLVVVHNISLPAGEFGNPFMRTYSATVSTVPRTQVLRTWRI